MVSRCVASVSIYSVCRALPRGCVLRNLPVAQWSGRSCWFVNGNQLRSQSTASSAFGHRGCSISQIPGGHGDSCRWMTKFTSPADFSRARVSGSRAYGRRLAAAMEGMGGLQETSSSSEERDLGGGRYCILLTGRASDYTEKLYGGYSQMFVKLLGDPQDIWDVYPVLEGIFPAEEDLAKYDGFVLTGSRHDAHGSEEWISKLCTLLQSLHEKKRKMLGICFGHQVMSRALGGKTGKSEIGWEIGLRKVQLTDAMFSKPYGVGVPPVLRIYQSHRDQVKEIPPGGELLGFSEKTGIEMYAVGDNVLAMQGHPEFSEDVVTDLVDMRLSLGMIKEDDAKVARDSMKEGPPDKEMLQRMCKVFLKGKRV